MGFIRDQQNQMAMRFLVWQYQKMNIPVPPLRELETQAGKIVDQAHKIAKQRGKNLLSIIKELVRDIIAKK